MTVPQPTSRPHFAGVAIAGVGLLGGSLAAAIKQRHLADRVMGIGRNVHRLEAAKNAGLIDEFSTKLTEAVTDADLLVLCTPVEQIVQELCVISGHCRPGTLITDVGSVKRSICEAGRNLPAEIHFVGAHPLAGSEKRGFEYSDANLFESRLCLLTPLAETPATAVNMVRDFWSAVGMQTRIMTPEDHDRALAATSHLPHLLAAALAASLPRDYRDLTATGFRDTTRIASGDPELWKQIFLSNADSIDEALTRLQITLQDFQTAIRNGDARALTAALQQSKSIRDSLDANTD